MPLIVSDIVDWKLDEDNDLIIPLQHVAGLPGVSQLIRIALQMFKGEWFLNLAAGTPWMENDTVPESEAVLGQRYSREKALNTIRQIITKVPGVKKILSLESTFDRATRKLSVSWEVVADWGDTERDSLDDMEI